MRIVLRFVLLTIVILPVISAAQTDRDRTIADFEEYIDGLLADTALVGLSVAYSHGDTYWENGYRRRPGTLCAGAQRR